MYISDHKGIVNHLLIAENNPVINKVKRIYFHLLWFSVTGSGMCALAEETNRALGDDKLFVVGN